MRTTKREKFNFISVDLNTLMRLEAAIDQMFLDIEFGVLKKSVDFLDDLSNDIQLTRHFNEPLDQEVFKEELCKSTNFTYKKPIRVHFSVSAFGSAASVSLLLRELDLLSVSGVELIISADDKDFVNKNAKNIEDIIKDCPKVPFYIFSKIYDKIDTLMIVLIFLLIGITIFIAGIEILSLSWIGHHPHSGAIIMGVAITTLGFPATAVVTSQVKKLVSFFELAIGPDRLRSGKNARRAAMWLSSVVGGWLIITVITAFIQIL
jgi:hypothetical protein